MPRESGIFYKSYYEAISSLPEASRLVMYEALMAYIFDGKECELNGVEKAFFTLIKPQIDANTKRYENGKKGGEYGKKGGRPSITKTPRIPQENPKGVADENPQITPNKNVNVNVNVNDDVHDDDNARECRDVVDVEKISKLMGVVVDEPPTHTPAEYEKAAEALRQSAWARANITHLSKIHKHWDKLLSGYYKDRAEAVKASEQIIPSDFANAAELNAEFDKANAELLDFL